ncbi:hypothetical protein pb186bvf_016077 [Paramecium bursaria]
MSKHSNVLIVCGWFYISLFYLLKDRLIANCKISKYNFPIKVFENYEFYKKIFQNYFINPLMDQVFKGCRQAGHDHLSVLYVCTFNQCNTSRFACSDCLLYETHKHEQKNNNHILNKIMFAEKINQDISEISNRLMNNSQYQPIIKLMKQKVLNIQMELKQLLNLIEDLEMNSIRLSDQEKLQNLRNSSSQQEFYKLDDGTLDQLLKIRQCSFNKLIQDKVGQFIRTIQQNSSEIQQISDYFIVQEQDLHIIHESVYEVDEKLIETAAISNDLQYLVQSGKQKELKVWNLQKNLITQYVQTENRPTVFKFSDDSIYLYAGTANGGIIQFDSQNLFQQLTSLMIHSKIVIQLICISNIILLTSSQDNYIIKTNISLKQQLLKVLAHQNTICSFDYDKYNNQIVSCSLDLNIKLWNGNDGTILLDKQYETILFQISIYGQQKMIFGLDLSNNILIWKLNYENKNIILQNTIQDQNGIYNFALVHDYKFILIICEKYVKVHTLSGEYIRQYNHKLSDLVFYDTRQLNSMEAIMIKGESKLFRQIRKSLSLQNTRKLIVERQYLQIIIQFFLFELISQPLILKNIHEIHRQVSNNNSPDNFFILQKLYLPHQFSYYLLFPKHKNIPYQLFNIRYFFQTFLKMGCSLKVQEPTDDLTLDTPKYKDKKDQKYINKTQPKRSIIIYGDEKIVDTFQEIQLWVQGPTPLSVQSNIDDSVNSLKSILSISRKFHANFPLDGNNRMDDSTIKKKKVRFSSKIEINQFINNQQYRKKIVTMKSFHKSQKKILDNSVFRGKTLITWVFYMENSNICKTFFIIFRIIQLKNDYFLFSKRTIVYNGFLDEILEITGRMNNIRLKRILDHLILKILEHDPNMHQNTIYNNNKQKSSIITTISFQRLSEACLIDQNSQNFIIHSLFTFHI